jgi:hypothetical protein
LPLVAGLLDQHPDLLQPPNLLAGVSRHIRQQPLDLVQLALQRRQLFLLFLQGTGRPLEAFEQAHLLCMLGFQGEEPLAKFLGVLQVGLAVQRFEAVADRRFGLLLDRQNSLQEVGLAHHRGEVGIQAFLELDFQGVQQPQVAGLLHFSERVDAPPRIGEPLADHVFHDFVVQGIAETRHILDPDLASIPGLAEELAVPLALLAPHPDATMGAVNQPRQPQVCRLRRTPLDGLPQLVLDRLPLLLGDDGREDGFIWENPGGLGPGAPPPDRDDPLRTIAQVFEKVSLPVLVPGRLANVGRVGQDGGDVRSEPGLVVRRLDASLVQGFGELVGADGLGGEPLEKPLDHLHPLGVAWSEAKDFLLFYGGHVALPVEGLGIAVRPHANPLEMPMPPEPPLLLAALVADDIEGVGNVAARPDASLRLAPHATKNVMGLGVLLVLAGLRPEAALEKSQTVIAGQQFTTDRPDVAAGVPELMDQAGVVPFVLPTDAVLVIDDDPLH